MIRLGKSGSRFFTDPSPNNGFFQIFCHHPLVQYCQQLSQFIFHNRNYIIRQYFVKPIVEWGCVATITN